MQSKAIEGEHCQSLRILRSDWLARPPVAEKLVN